MRGGHSSGALPVPSSNGALAIGFARASASTDHGSWRDAKALKAAEALEAKGVTPTVADARFAKPLDTELVERLVKEHEVVVTIEEASIGEESVRRGRVSSALSGTATGSDG